MKRGERSPQCEKSLLRIVTSRESGMRTADENRVPRAVTTRSWRTMSRDVRTSTSASPPIGPIVTLPTVTCEARSKISRSILAPGVPMMRSGLPVRQRTTISR